MDAAAATVGSSPVGSSVMPMTIASLRFCAKAKGGRAEVTAVAAEAVRTVRRFSMLRLQADAGMEERNVISRVSELRCRRRLGARHGGQQRLRVRVLGMREQAL